MAGGRERIRREGGRKQIKVEKNEVRGCDLNAVWTWYSDTKLFSSRI